MTPKITGLWLALLCLSLSAHAQDPLDNYIQRLRRSASTGGSETAFLSVGSTFLYGQDFFDKKEYNLAALYFKEAYGKDTSNPYLNYQIAASLLRQNNPQKTEEAKKYWQSALRQNPALQGRLAKEFPQLLSAVAATENAPVRQSGLSAYIEALRHSKAIGDSRTAMNTPGLEVLYGLEHYEKGDYDLAASRLRMAVQKDPNDPYAAYLLAVSLVAQDQIQEGSRYLAAAVQKESSLAQLAEKDIAAARERFLQKQKQNNLPALPAAASTKGGKLVYGTYTCSQTVWRGAGINGGFGSPIQKGSFSLNANGTYRWLDNGGTGRYSYDRRSGNLTWLSGPLAEKQIQSSTFQPNKTIAQITLNFSEAYRWECGCKK